jgi:hypothetical protein
MKNTENDKMTKPNAPIMLKTFATPTAAIQAGMAKTKIVLNVFLTNVRAVSASPTISLRRG